MTVFDYAVLGIIGVSVLLSLLRGFVREFFGLAGWVGATYAAKTYAAALALQLPASIPNQTLRMIAAFVIIFLGILLIASLLSITLGELFRQTGMGWLDRGLGGLFGFARGLLIVGVLVLLGGMTSFPQDPRWRNAMLSAPVEAMVLACKPWLPREIAGNLKYE